MSESVAVVVPQVNPNDEHAVLVRWHVECGSRVVAGQPLVTLETTKANFDVEAPLGGYAFFDCAPRTLVNVGTTIAWISDTDTPPPVIEPAAAGNGEEGTEARFTRKAARLMREQGLTPEDFDGHGRIDTAEVERVVRARGRADAGTPTPSDADPLESSPAKLLEGRTLVEVYRQIVPSLVSVSVSCSRTDAHLHSLAETIGPVSLLELAIYEVARLLASFPDLNGFVAEGRLWTYRSVAIGFAINAGRSLRVPVVSGAAALSQLEVSRAVRDLSLRYMRDELQLADVMAGTFTITDLSAEGVEHFVPVLYHRQAAILGICAERAGTGRRELVLAFDHRMSDGMRAAQFLVALRTRLEASPPCSSTHPSS